MKIVPTLLDFQRTKGDEMTIKIPYRGIIEIVGDHDVGKTIAALQASNNMKDVCFVDDDVKGEGTVRQMREAGMEFDDYIDLAPMRLSLGRAPTADQLIDEVLDPAINRITGKKRKIIIWDTWRIVYQSLRLHVERNQIKYSSVVKWQGNSTIIQGLISRVARGLELQYLNRLKASSDLLIITHHVKDWYESNVLVGRIPESSNTFSEVCNMRLWLRRNHQSKVPVILFLKRPNVPKIASGKLTFVNIVPLKITPTDRHESIWDAIAEYEQKPIQSRQPRPDETPTPDELMAISGTLTNEMRDFVKSSIDYQLKQEKELQDAMAEINEEKEQETKKKAPSNVPENAVQLLTKAKAELGYSLNNIERILEMPFSEINDPKHNIKALWEVLVSMRESEISEAVAGKKAKK